jgi:hypothetical protein
VVVATLENATSAVVGIVLEPGNFQGAITTTLEGCTSVFAGSHVAPVFTGTVGATLEDVTTLVQALFVQSGATLALVASNLEDATADFHGQTAGNIVSPTRVVRGRHRRTIRVRRRA